MHYGPPPEPSGPPSGMTTPASESKRFSDPPASWDASRMGWGWTSDGGLGKGGELDPLHFGDGPPYSEDEDLASPIVSSRHRKHKSTSATLGHGKTRGPRDERSAGSSFLSQETYNQDRGYYVGTSSDGNERYYINQGGEANGPGGEYVTYPTESARHSTYQSMDHPQRQYADESGYRSESDASDTASSPGFNNYDESRYSRDYQFTITSPDEEMHGKAVALFDFARENENELPLVEGQIIWVSYRHGQGWLVAEDPKTQESGLVPEEYVRLLRDIEGGMTSLTGQLNDGLASPNDAGTPTQAEHNSNQLSSVATQSTATVPTTTTATQSGHAPSSSNPTNGYHQPVVSVFSTSSKDLDPYPQHLLGTQAGHPPPQVVHYHGQRGGSQANTPTAKETFENGMGRRGSQDAKRSSSASRKSQKLETLPHSRMKSPMADPEGDDDEGYEQGSEQLER
ncbi:hypothetical protein MGN70_005881 [Eutypa lata]|uniref:Putative sh3 domain containing protein n=1 Tax=Eutypa lata (strain UCR-EL1) TaxID=1287681 RepID=M7TE30_EUTLA|nr:putative sh3 domain containing protein [Eutypa lata UCREL1]KAI1251315.1 hypothetical protein MGN70_005881 [Eutypa lata]